MKKIIRLCLFAAAIFLQSAASGNTIIVKGYISDNNNIAVAGKSVRIYTDSSTQSCIISHVKTTNANGYYIDTLTCNGDIHNVRVDVEDCTGNHIIKSPSTTNASVLECNFTICVSQPNCNYSFATVSAAGSAGLPFTTTVQFNSRPYTLASSTDTTTTTNHTWNFGDSTSSVSSFKANITHSYSKPGTYNVCLYTKTITGCESKICNTILVGDSINRTPAPPTTCKAQFTYTLAGDTLKLNSANSVAAGSTDSIISRTWYFSDSTNASITGNRVDPIHVFAKAGTYTVYLSIKTKLGCSSYYSTQIVIKDTTPVKPPVPTTCKANFTYTLQGYTVKLNSAGSVAATSVDSITSRTWYFSDSTAASSTITGNIIDPTRVFAKPGTYTVYLSIKTKLGCSSYYSTQIVIKDSTPVKPPVPTTCKASFTYTLQGYTVKLNSAASVAATSADSITSRTWYFSDSTTASSVIQGNIVDPSHTFAKPGTYTVYLAITTKLGCSSKYSTTVTIKDTVPTNCKAIFNYAIQAATVAFNSSASTATSSTDSIISRYWIFGDSTSLTTGVNGSNIISPSHTYAKAGTYQVILYIKTSKGCESRYAATVTISTAAFHCEALASFTAEHTSLKNIQFNSSLSKAQLGDSIISRNWNFGDSTVLAGNEISPSKEYTTAGYYNACLQINTARGCASKTCKELTILDSVTTPQSNIEYIKIITINPNPVVTNMYLTVWSRNSNAETEISVFDIYGTSRFTIKKILTQGNNIIQVNTESLMHGPYFIKVSTKNGKDSKQFYKL